MSAIITQELIETTTRHGVAFTARAFGNPDAPKVLFLHDVYGLFTSEPLLEALGATYRVLAPQWPGYGDQPTELGLRDMLDFTLHGWDLAEALGLCGDDGRSPIRLVGHGFGGMIAAEMAATRPSLVSSLVLLAPLGLWNDAAPLPDVFASLPFEVPGMLFHDAAAGSALMFGGLDAGDPVALQKFVIGNSRRLGTAGKVMFPIPDRGVRKRLPRITAATTIVWGSDDRLVPAEPYAHEWSAAIPGARLELRGSAGHALGHEVTEADVAVLRQALA